jgi:CheY-like chemotaxis protein
MAKIVTVGLDAGLVERALSRGTRETTCWEAEGAPAVLRTLETAVPDLVVLGGDARSAADTAEALVDEPRLLGTSLVAWSIEGSLADTSRLLALGVRVVAGEASDLERACAEALDAREGRTIRVDPPTEVRSARSDVLDLHGRRVIVADDDPAITWFFADQLRAEGCDVQEAPDGAVALDAARRSLPDLVLTDIRMPRMDGVRLTRALRADPVLADVPVILLSWKEDWLRDARDIGVEASAYLQKRCAPEEIAVRVRQVLAPQVRLEQRVREPGAVRGRLDGSAPHRLLRLTCAMRVDANLTVRCHPHAYEIQIRDGAPRSALRVSADGAVARGLDALASLLDERSGKFTLTSSQSPVDGELEGSLHQQIASYVARRRRTSEMPVSGARPPASEPSLRSAPAPSKAAPVAASAPPSAPSAHAQPLPAEPAARTVPLLRPVARPAHQAPSTPRSPMEPTMPLPRAAPICPPPYAFAAHPAFGPAAAYAPAPASAIPLAAVLPFPAARVPPAPAVVAEEPRRRRGVPLRWVGIAAIAALGIVLGAGARALHQADADVTGPAPSTAGR